MHIEVRVQYEGTTLGPLSVQCEGTWTHYLGCVAWDLYLCNVKVPVQITLAVWLETFTCTMWRYLYTLPWLCGLRPLPVQCEGTWTHYLVHNCRCESVTSVLSCVMWRHILPWLWFESFTCYLVAWGLNPSNEKIKHYLCFGLRPLSVILWLEALTLVMRR